MEGKRPPLDDVEEGDTPRLTRTHKAGTNDPPVTALTPPDEHPGPAERTGHPPPMGERERPPTQAEIAAEKDRQEKAALEKAAAEIKAAVQGDPALAELSKQLAIDMTPEGLRIQIMDEVKLPMFASGSADPNERARALLRKVVPVLRALPEAISIAGHTDATPFAGNGKTNWELSTERANATRHLLTEAGLEDTRIRTVTGHADRDPLLPADPFAAANRRIAIVVLRAATKP